MIIVKGLIRNLLVTKGLGNTIDFYAVKQQLCFNTPITIEYNYRSPVEIVLSFVNSIVKIFNFKTTVTKEKSFYSDIIDSLSFRATIGDECDE